MFLPIPLRRKKTFREKAKEFLTRRLPERTRHFFRSLPTRGYLKEVFSFMLRTAKRKTCYVFEDFWFMAKKLKRYSEVLLFSALLLATLFMLSNAEGESFLNVLTAFIMLILVLVIYMQIRLQRKAMSDYVPEIDILKVKSCRMFSDRIRTVNVYGAKEHMEKIKKVRNIEIAYDAMNSSFSPVSIQAASAVMKMKSGRRISIPEEMCVLNVQPKRTSGTRITFRLDRPARADSVVWLELHLKGNCRKKVRIKPVLYVNLVLRGKETKFVFEPFSKFMKRPEMASK